MPCMSYYIICWHFLPGKMTTRLVHLHLCALKLIQLLPDGGLNNTRSTVYVQTTFNPEFGKHCLECVVVCSLTLSAAVSRVHGLSALRS